MSETLVEALELENHLTLKLYDGSKQIAGDRWLIKFIAQVEIPVDSSVVDITEIDWDAIKTALGPMIVFEQKRERNFIDDEEKNTVFQSLQDNFKTTQMPYLNHPEFAKRFILRRYKECQHVIGQV